jgi:catechol 2,3-dioxygenase-like lactoylglutathione lyase family enzyme
VIRTRGLTQVALKVRDVDRAISFYAAVFRRSRGVPKPGVRPGADARQLRRARVRERLEGTAASGDIAHFGFRLLDPADIERQLSRRGCGRHPCQPR